MENDSTNNVLSRKELYDLVWSTSLTKISERYSTTISKVKTICKKHCIPIPDNGYWQKLKHNKPVIIKEFLNVCDENFQIDLSPIYLMSPLNYLANQIEKENPKQLIVPEKLSNPDSLIVETKKEWREWKNKNNHWRDYKRVLSIRVEDKNRSRALRFMNILIKLLKKRGHYVKNNEYETVAVVFGIELEIDLREANKRIPSKDIYGTSDYIPTGILVFKTNRWYHEKEWRDGRFPIEKQLSKIVAKLELDAKEEIEQKKRQEIYRIKREKEEAIRREQQGIYDKEVQKFKSLKSNAEEYNTAVLLRNYITAFKNKLETNNNLTSEQENWINWANKKADWVDPLVDVEDEILSYF